MQKLKRRRLEATKVVTTEVGDTKAAGKCIDDNNENYVRVKCDVINGQNMRKGQTCGRVFAAADNFPISV